jgi:hypothetical protein
MLDVNALRSTIAPLFDLGIRHIEIEGPQFIVSISVRPSYASVAPPAPAAPAASPAPVAPAAPPAPVAPPFDLDPVPVKGPAPEAISVPALQELGRKFITAKGRSAFDEVMKATGKAKISELSADERSAVASTLTHMLGG